mgnify:CR=1 FL=1
MLLFLNSSATALATVKNFDTLTSDNRKVLTTSLSKSSFFCENLGLNKVEALTLIEDKIKETKEAASLMLKNIGNGDNKVFVGYGAPAKVVTFLAQMELEDINLIGIIEDNKDKQNRFLPGSGFSIKSLEEIQKLTSMNKSNELCISFLIFPWNLKKEIIEKLSKWVPKNSNAVVFFPKVEKVEI